MPDQYLGPRSSYLYTSDTGETYSIYTDDSIATAGGLTAVGSGSTPGSLPRYFKPRGLHWIDGQGRRKFIYVGSVGSPLWADGRRAVSVEGEEGTVTGRRGEQATFL